jgi:hypothetical protein
LEELKIRESLMDATEIARELGVSLTTVSDHYGRMPALQLRTVVIDGHTFLVAPAAAVDAFKRGWRAGGDRRRTNWLRPTHAEKVLAARGIEADRSAVMRRSGTLSGTQGGRASEAMRDPDFANKAAKVLKIHSANPRLGARTLAREADLSHWQVRQILAALAPPSAR